MSDTPNEQTPLEQVKEQQETQPSPLDQVREQQENQQQALKAKEEEAKNHRPPPEVDPAGNRKEHPQRQLG